MSAGRVGALVMVAAAFAPIALYAFMFSTSPGPPVSGVIVIGVLVATPFVASAIVVGTLRQAQGARLAGFLGGAAAGVLVTILAEGFSGIQSHVDWGALPFFALVFVSGGAFFAGLGGLAGYALFGGATAAAAPASEPRATRTREGRCSHCDAQLALHAWQCARCGAWTESA